MGLDLIPLIFPLGVGLEGGACSEGVPALRGCLLLGVPAPEGGVIPACTEADPPVNRMTNSSKNITSATTSLRPVKTLINHPSHTHFLSFVKYLVPEALDTRDPPIICKTLKVMMTLANLDVDDGTGRMIKAGAALVPYYRQLLPVLNMFKMKNGKYLKTTTFFPILTKVVFKMSITDTNVHYHRTRKFPKYNKSKNKRCHKIHCIMEFKFSSIHSSISHLVKQSTPVEH